MDFCLLDMGSKGTKDDGESEVGFPLLQNLTVEGGLFELEKCLLLDLGLEWRCDFGLL